MNTKSIHLKTGIIDWLFNPVRNWIDNVQIKHVWAALIVVRMIPPTCPFERTIAIRGHTILKIPKLCGFNPTYEQLVGLRFKALDCPSANQVDVTPYITVK